MAPPFDTSLVSPSDAVVTMRSLRRRFAEVLTGPGLAEAPGDPLHRRSTEGGLSPIEHAAWTASALADIGRALRKVLVERDPVIELPPIDGTPPLASASLSAEDAVAQVGDASETLAGLMAGVHGADWTRTGRTGDGEVTALGSARLAVRISIEHLRAAGQSFGSGGDGNHHPQQYR